MTDRVLKLDGLRGLAIALVVLFHTFSRWPDYIDLVAVYGGFPLFKYGWLGVQLFFLISGYVIFMSLDRQDSFRGFIKARFLRLWPAMFFATFLIYLSAPLFASRPAGQPEIWDIISGLLFIQPDFIQKIIPSAGLLEGAFWSLFVEVKFYIFFASVYFVYGRFAAIFTIIAVSFLFFSAKTMVYIGLCGDVILRPFYLLGADHFFWFAAGAFLYYTKCKISFYSVMIFLGLIAFASIARLGVHLDLVAGFMVGFVFWLAMSTRILDQLLSVRPLIFLGFISYPLYLTHENALVSMIAVTQNYYIYDLMAPIIPIILICLVSWIIAKFIEPRIRFSVSRIFE